MNTTSVQLTAEERTSKTILVVEEDEAICQVLEATITQETSYRAICVANGEEALHMLQGIQANLFLIDDYQTGSNGIALYDQLHALAQFAHVPTIILTANLSVQQEELASRNITAVEKPFELEDLINIIKKLLV
jgi:CheY-like chemotaxis protein